MINQNGVAEPSTWGFSKWCEVFGRQKALQVGIAQKFGLRGSITMHDEHPFELRYPGSDMWLYFHIIREGEYNPITQIVPSPKIILDCGANIGATGKFFLDTFPDVHYVGLEPFGRNFEICKKNLSYYGARAEVLHAAVWSHNCHLVFEPDTTREGKESGVRVREAVSPAEGEVRAYDVPTLMQMFDVPRIDILKVDIEGSERELFGEASKEWLPDIGSIAIELHEQHIQNNAAFAGCNSPFTQRMAELGVQTFTRGEVTFAQLSGSTQVSQPRTRGARR